ncbi:uncharacterized protein LOC134214469 [Armigeres subalbatus]|uniref:uncharacterized protein LOC134214469 n=1 Tax=Armigeres subalbatus TaxID=124917 RepID=UPI002ED6447E
MIGSQTAAKLKETIEQEVLKVYGIQPEQILTVTHDNGSNMIASVARLRDSLTEDEKPFMQDEIRAVEAVYQVTESYRRIDLAAMDEAMDDNENNNESADNDLSVEDESGIDCDSEENESEDILDDSEELMLEGTRCAAHTCQLAVWDVLKKHEAGINVVKKLVKMTRQSKYKEMFVEHKASFAPISNATRWNAVYLMLKALREQKPFYLMLENKFPELRFSKHWNFIDKFSRALEPLFFLSVSLQQKHVPLSEFYTQWLICQAHLNAMKDNSVALKLLKAMEKRLSKLIGTIQFKASLYLDPRFNYIGSNRISISDKEAAQRFLLKLWHRLNVLDGRSESQEETYDGEDEVLESYLNNYFQKDSPCVEEETTPSENSKVYQLLKELELRPKVPIITPAHFKPTSSISEPSTSSTKVSMMPTSKKEPFDILRYWIAEEVRNPQMFRLAVVIYSAPSTQVSVERAFSALKLILTDHRQRLSDRRIQDIMVLKLNPELLPDVAKQLNLDMEAYVAELE